MPNNPIADYVREHIPRTVIKANVGKKTVKIDGWNTMIWLLTEVDAEKMNIIVRKVAENDPTRIPALSRILVHLVYSQFITGSEKDQEQRNANQIAEKVIKPLAIEQKKQSVAYGAIANLAKFHGDALLNVLRDPIVVNGRHAFDVEENGDVDQAQGLIEFHSLLDRRGAEAVKALAAGLETIADRISPDAKIGQYDRLIRWYVQTALMSEQHKLTGDIMKSLNHVRAKGVSAEMTYWGCYRRNELAFDRAIEECPETSPFVGALKNMRSVIVHGYITPEALGETETKDGLEAFPAHKPIGVGTPHAESTEAEGKKPAIYKYDGYAQQVLTEFISVVSAIKQRLSDDEKGKSYLWGNFGKKNAEVKILNGRFIVFVFKYCHRWWLLLDSPLEGNAAYMLRGKPNSDDLDQLIAALDKKRSAIQRTMKGTVFHNPHGVGKQIPPKQTILELLKLADCHVLDA